MKELIEQMEKKWDGLVEEHNVLIEELVECKDENSVLRGKLEVAQKEVVKYKTKWSELMKKIEGEMNDEN